MYRQLALVAALGVTFGAIRPADAEFDECGADDEPLVVEKDRIACQRISSPAVGGVIPFSYFVPSVCTTDHRCPVLYLLHGFGGSYTSLLGAAGSTTSAYPKALTSGPPVDPTDPTEAPMPWIYANTATWVDEPDLEMILVAPHGRTVPGGFGPEPGLDGFWTDWNPRYADGGDLAEYGYPSPPPQLTTYLLRDLIPFVEANLPALQAGRSGRALDGESLGGYGSYKNGLQHPDEFASVGSISGAFNFLFAPAPDPLPASSPVGVSAPGGFEHFALIGPATFVPLSSLPNELKGFAVALRALGDPVADQAFFRGNMPRDLAMNARAWTGPEQTLALRALVNDAIPRRAEDLNPGIVTAQGFEDIVLPMNLEQRAAFETQGVAMHLEIHPGLHSRPYRDPYLRQELEAHYARVAHADGAPAAVAPADRFDYRSIAADFTIWGWHVAVERPNVEFLNLRGVTCAGLDVQGSGVVTVTRPASCGGGSRTEDLGASPPIDEPAGASAVPAYGATRAITF